MTKFKVKMQVAVYGTLMNGHIRHSALENAKLLGTFQTEPKFNMYAHSNNYPFLTKEGGTSITMEVYQFTDKNILNRLDDIEGVRPSGGGLFVREKMNTPYGPSEFYYMTEESNSGAVRIESGDWNDYTKTKNTKI